MTAEEQGTFTAGGNQRSKLPANEAAEEEQEIDPSIVGSLDNVYPDKPGTEMECEEDPFKKVPVMNDHEKPSSLLDMERSMDAVVVYSEQDSSPLEEESIDLGNGPSGTADLPDVIGRQGNSQPPDVTDQNSSHEPCPPPDLAVGAQRSVDLLDDASSVESTQPVDLTEGLND